MKYNSSDPIGRMVAVNRKRYTDDELHQYRKASYGHKAIASLNSLTVAETRRLSRPHQ